jgi:hypothetical protein
MDVSRGRGFRRSVTSAFGHIETLDDGSVTRLQVTAGGV